MARRQRQGEPVSQQAGCEICGRSASSQEELNKHLGICKSLRLFRETVVPDFEEAMKHVPEQHRTGLLNQFGSCSTIQDMVSVLDLLKDAKSVREDKNVLDRLRQIQEAALQFRLAAEYVTVDRLRSALRPRVYKALHRVHRTRLMAQYDQTYSVFELAQFIERLVSRLASRLEPTSAAKRLLAEINYFIAVLPDDDPPTASAVVHEPPRLQSA